MKVTFEGTPEELSALFPHLRQQEDHPDGVIDTARPPEADKGSEDEGSSMSLDAARSVLTRLPLGTGARTVLKALYAAHPSWLSVSDLAKEVGYTHNQFVGLMGAFGRRVANTPGVVADSYFFEFKWDGNGIMYRLTDVSREALKLERVV